MGERRSSKPTSGTSNPRAIHGGSSYFMKLSFVASALGAALGLVALSLPVIGAQATRNSAEDVNSPALRERPGLVPGDSLLHNGWGVTPAGRQVKISDMALKMIVSPDRRRLVAVSAGFNNTGVTLFDLKTKAVAE